MRTKERRPYDKVTKLPAKALRVYEYSQLGNKPTTPAYIHVKYNRFKFGYENTKGVLVYGEKPEYKLVDFQGIVFVIPD